MVDLKALVADRLVELAPSVSTSVIETLAQKEHGKRIEAFMFVVEELDKQTKELKKISKPDIVTYNADRSIASSQYTKETLDKMGKIRENIDRLVTAIDMTESTPRDFTKLIELYDKSGNK